MNIFTDPAKRAEFVFGQPMKPCPKCGSYRMIAQTPIVMKEPILATDTAKQMVGKWARAVKDGNEVIEKDVFIMCRDCGHRAPGVDRPGILRSKVANDKMVYLEMKRLWNEQT